MQNETGRYTTTYDELGQMRTVTAPANFRTTYAWDAAGQRAVMTAPTGGRFTYQYDGAGQITRLINPEGDRTTFAYDADSRRTVKKLANGTRASFTYDAASNLTTLANLFPDGTYISKYDYKYDATGNRYAVAEADGSRVTWLYDNLYQLTGENRTGTTPFRNTFTYDPLGNRLAKTESDVRTTYAYDAANQLKYALDVSGRTTYTFDAAGNQQRVVDPSGARTTTVWNYENQPTLYKLPDATRVTMAYHPDLLRVQKDTSAGTTKFIWDDQNYLAEADGPNVVTTVYTNEPERYGRLVSSKIGPNVYSHCFDAIGSTRQDCDCHGDLLNSWVYTANGDLSSGQLTHCNPFLWTSSIGYYTDVELNSIQVRFRTYCVSTARWTAVDRMYSTQFGSANRFKHIDLCPTVVLQEQMECSWRLAERINLYGYVVNNAINLADPSGLLFGWGYGNFCGYSRRAACPPGTGPLMPIDAVDAACERHDCCHETWWSCNPLHLSKCSGALCQELLDAWHFGCAQSWGEDKKSACACEIASLQAGALFGGITVLVRLGLPIGIFDSSQSRPTSPRASVVRPGLDAAIKGALE